MSSLKVLILTIVTLLCIVLIFDAQIIDVAIKLTGLVAGSSKAVESSFRSKPYVEAFSFNDETVRADAAQIISNCPKHDESCFIIKIYEYVVNNYKYITDPTRMETIQSYKYSKTIGGGDCEDLTVVLASLLENIGVKTYFVLTDTHGYLLACAKKLSEEILGEKKSINLLKVSLLKSSFKFIPFNYEGEEKNLRLEYSITSDRLVSVFAVPSDEDVELFKLEKSFNQYTECMIQRSSNKKKQCAVDNIAGFIIKNEYNGETNVFLNAKISSRHKGNVRYYEVDNMQCVVLDGTAGPNGYPGFEEKLKGVKTAIDPKSERAFILP